MEEKWFEIGNRITALREEHKMTQEELANCLGVSRITVSKWENAQARPSKKNLTELCSFFGITTKELLSEHLPPEIKEYYLNCVQEEVAAGALHLTENKENTDDKCIRSHRNYRICLISAIITGIACVVFLMLAAPFAMSAFKPAVGEADSVIDAIIEYYLNSRGKLLSCFLSGIALILCVIFFCKAILIKRKEKEAKKDLLRQKDKM